MHTKTDAPETRKWPLESSRTNFHKTPRWRFEINQRQNRCARLLSQVWTLRETTRSLCPSALRSWMLIRMGMWLELRITGVSKNSTNFQKLVFSLYIYLHFLQTKSLFWDNKGWERSLLWRFFDVLAIYVEFLRFFWDHRCTACRKWMEPERKHQDSDAQQK